jgi:DNA polymerase-3 subunit delta'
VSGDSDIPAPWSHGRLTGHGEAEAALLQAWQSGRLPHAWLIAGPRGIGKATLAYRFARFLFDREGAGAGLFAETPADLSVAPEASAFHLVANRSHPGLKVLERTENPRSGQLRSEIVVDQVRELAGFYGMTRAGGGWRVTIVDGADEMNANAANAILKTLEEPPERGVILLLAHAAGRLLPTIRSRCRKLNLRPLSVDQVAAVVAEARPDLAGDELAALAALAEGSPGRALALAGTEGLDTYRQLVQWARDLPRLPQTEVHALADRLNRRGGEAQYALWTELFSLFLARTIRAAGGGGPVEAVAGEWSLAQRIGTQGALDHWVDLWEKVTRLAARANSLNLERKQVVLSAMLAFEATAREQLS